METHLALCVGMAIRLFCGSPCTVQWSRTTFMAVRNGSETTGMLSRAGRERGGKVRASVCVGQLSALCLGP